MRCDRYEQDLTAGAAGGAITPDLEAHLEVCAACRGRRAEKQAVLGHIDQVLTSHLDVEPSPALRSRVISRVAQAEGKRRRLAPWAAAAALAAGLGIALLAGLRVNYVRPDEAAQRLVAFVIDKPPPSPPPPAQREHRASAEQLTDLANAWRAWAAAPDGWFAVTHGEVICFGN